MINKSERKAWLVTITASLFFCYIFAQIGMFNSLEKVLVKDLNISSIEYGKLSAYYFFGNLLFLIPAGLLLDRFSTVKILTVVSIITAASTYGFAISEQILTAKMMRLITGLCGSFALLTVLRLATRWFNSERLALVIGVVVTLAMLGGMLSQTPFIWLLDQYGWRQSLIYISYIGFIIALLTAFAFTGANGKGCASAFLLCCCGFCCAACIGDVIVLLQALAKERQTNLY